MDVRHKREVLMNDGPFFKRRFTSLFSQLLFCSDWRNLFLVSAILTGFSVKLISEVFTHEFLNELANRTRANILIVNWKKIFVLQNMKISTILNFEY